MNDINYSEIVRKLVKLRKKHNISITGMADYAGVSRQGIYYFEIERNKSYRLMLSYLTHPAFSREELNEIYELMGG